VSALGDIWRVGERIKEARSEDSLTQAQLAEKIDVKRQTIGKWEMGESNPEMKHLEKLCQVFECDLAYLLGEIDMRRRVSADIAAITGLSEKAIEYLSDMRRNAQNLMSWRLDDDENRTPLENMFQQEIDVISALLEDAQSCSPDAPSALPNIFSYVLRSLREPDSGYFEIVDGNENVGTFTREDLENASLYTGVMHAVKRFKQQFTAEQRAGAVPRRSEEVPSSGED
jgi:DNA-binding XRE family transcriptional regulator